MRRILFVCNTYYQLITALQCTNTLFASDSVDLLLSDHSRNAEAVVNRLNETAVFNKTAFFASKEIDQGNHGSFAVMKELLTSVLGHSGSLQKILGNSVYDELIYYNLNSSISQLYGVLEKRNKDIKCSRLEEGIASYNNLFHEKGYGHYTKRIDLAIKIRLQIGKQIIIDNCHNFYCFFPEYYNGNFNAVGIPLIKDDDIIRSQLASIFHVTDDDYIKEKYIFFTSVYDFEGDSPIREFETVKKVAELVGKENMIVKIHPRDNRNIYQQYGIKVARASTVPWEALQLRFGYKDKVLLTATSGAILSTNMMVSNPINSYFLFNECNIDSNHLAVNTVNELKKIMKDEQLSKRLYTVHIAKNIEETLK